MTAGAETVKKLLDSGYRLVFWPAVEDHKGPQGLEAANWPERAYTFDDYKEGMRVGVLLGAELEEGWHLSDTDLDWAPIIRIALRFLPPTEMVWGREGKKPSHALYLTRAKLSTKAWKAIGADGKDSITLLERRAARADGQLGHQSMLPPSIWANKEGKQEPLEFIKFGSPGKTEADRYERALNLTAVGGQLAFTLGVNGFGHDARLAWAGHLLRRGVSVEDLVAMGEAMSDHCQNLEVDDVRRVVESTNQRLNDPQQKIKGAKSLAQLLGPHGKKILERIDQWLGVETDFQRNKNGFPLSDSQFNVNRALDLMGAELRYNEFADRMTLAMDGNPPLHLEDRQVNELWLRADDEFHFRPAYEFFERVVKRRAWSAPFHPVREWLASLKWDGKPRIATWLIDHAGAKDDPYVREISRITLIAAVRRVRHPGVKFDEMLVLESPQGFEKSSALRALCHDPDWFSDDLPLNVDSKQMIEKTLGKWIIEASDLAGKRKAEVEQLKATLSRQVDGPARLAYGRFPVERPRSHITVGTTNSPAYLTDPTGNRRFWPCKIGAFDIKALIANRDQLWAEAAALEAAGASIRLDRSFWGEAGKAQEDRREMDAWEPLIEGALLNIAPHSDGRIRVATESLWMMLGIEPSRRDTAGARRISEIMHRLGYERTRVRPKGSAVQVGYISPEPEGIVVEGETDDSQRID